MSISAARSAQVIASTANFLAPIEDELKLVEETLSRELYSSVNTVAFAASHVLEAGGKRLRPSLVLLSARACVDGFDADQLVNMAAVAEMVHMATLIHDDVIDEADSRRGRETANARWGNQISVLTGDYVVAKAFSMLARHADPRMMHVLAQATVEMTEGEIRQIESCGDTAAPVAQYHSIIRGKTAAFTSACCEVGAILAGSRKSTEESLAKYGLAIGMAFQITDDVLDLIGDPKLTGKPVGGDIREGKVTLPLILALERSNASDRQTIETIIHSRNASVEETACVRKIAEETGSIEAARDSAAEFINEALLHLNILPESQAKESLKNLAHHILEREK